jgi:hypothetical protein
MNYQPVIIIGAPRSGTNMLRDVLTNIEGVSTWPCDEINYIWRHGNVRYNSDVFPSQLARKEVAAYIRSEFDKLAAQVPARYVVEKTCANSLRVDYVDRIVPNAKYIYIIRHGYDVVASAVKRWKAELDLRYILAKARYVPISDIPYYASRYLANRIHRLISKDKHLAFWGPRLDDMRSIVAKHTLPEVCAIQWRECVDRSDKSFERMPDERIYRLQYETFVEDPERELGHICEFLEINIPKEDRGKVIGSISRSSVGKGIGELGEHVTKVRPLIESTLKRHGYL